jgi:cullin 3
VQFNKDTKRGIICSTYQMLILLVFNSQLRVTAKEIREITGIPKTQLANHLLSLAHPKVQVLQKRPNSNKLADDHKFMLNANFKSQLRLVSVPVMQVEKSESAETDEQKAIMLQRMHQMDACIVRIMKTRKTLRHPQLVSECVQQLKARFTPQPSLVKKRIESLIESDYLVRDEDDRATYNYVA